MPSTTDADETDELRDRLGRAATRLSEAEERVAAVGEDDLEAVADAVDEFEALLDRYEERAVGTGDFEAFVRFQEEVEQFVEGLDGDLPARDAFETAETELDRRRLKESHFRRAREAISPARDHVDRLTERREAAESYREAYRAVQDRRDELDDEIAELETVRRLGQADIEAPTEQLREPIEAYDGAVTDAFDEYVRETSARAVLGLVERTGAYPLVEFREPPADLLAYVRDHEAGTEPIPTLLEYAEYSRSKLGHYVDDPDALKRAVATQRTYLQRLDAGPLTVGWPPPEATTLRMRADEYESVVHRFAGEDVTARLRTVRRLPVETDYARLREAAVADAELDDEQRRLLERGEVVARLEELREHREALAAALAEHPEP